MSDSITARVKRLPDNPIITAAMCEKIGDNINGPSLLKVPDWVDNPLGRYYLYFAHHKGKCIRLAYADSPWGPWTIHQPGTLQLSESLFPEHINEADLSPELRDMLDVTRQAGDDDPLYTHIASPDVIAVAEHKEIRMYYHGRLENSLQASRVATSSDGLSFTALPPVISRPYLRVFKWDNKFYGMAMPGVFYRSDDGLTGFEQGPDLFNRNMRHAALMIRDNTLNVFWTQVGDNPEHILLSTISLSADWRNWQASEPRSILKPEYDWEGAGLPMIPSVRGAIEEPANQLRDPGIYEEDSKAWLLYSVCGESGIAIAELELTGAV